MQGTFEIETGFVKWAQSVGLMTQDYKELAEMEDSGDVYFVP